MDILELLDGQQIEVVRILGGPRLINGVMRDTLSIEVDPSTMSLDELASIFKDSSKTNHLFTYIDENDSKVKVEIGEGYDIFVSAHLEHRKVDRVPGKIAPDQYEDIIVVNIAQLTYDEYQDFQNGTWVPPDIQS